jgi:hypothetical protein
MPRKVDFYFILSLTGRFVEEDVPDSFRIMALPKGLLGSLRFGEKMVRSEF